MKLRKIGHNFRKWSVSKIDVTKKTKKNFDKNVILDYLLFLIDFENKIAILSEENLE